MGPEEPKTREGQAGDAKATVPAQKPEGMQAPTENGNWKNGLDFVAEVVVEVVAAVVEGILD